MKILVTAASKHGSALEIANAVATRLRANGQEVEQVAPDEVQSVTDYDVVVIGSSVYMRQWMDSANQFVERFNDQLKKIPVWTFSVGMAGVPKKAPQDPQRIGPVSTQRYFRHHQVFAGRYDPVKLTLRERSVARLAGAVEGDFRDWEAINSWADSISAALE